MVPLLEPYCLGRAFELGSEAEDRVRVGRRGVQRGRTRAEHDFVVHRRAPSRPAQVNSLAPRVLIPLRMKPGNQCHYHRRVLSFVSSAGRVIRPYLSHQRLLRPEIQAYVLEHSPQPVVVRYVRGSDSNQADTHRSNTTTTTESFSLGGRLLSSKTLPLLQDRVPNARVRDYIIF